MKTRLLFVLFVLIIVGCRANAPEAANDSSAASDQLVVSAAVSLKDAFSEIGELYKSKTGKTVGFNFGASGALARQIETGAPVDVFASAGAPQMDEIAAKNLIDWETRRDFARNTLVLIAPNDSKLNLQAFSDLTKTDVEKIAVGNPKTVPAGQYTEQVFEKFDLKTNLQSKLITGEDVRQVLDYVVRGEVDAGIVYRSDARGASDKVRVVTTAPDDSHQPILYPIAVVRDSRRKAAAQEFINLVMSAEGQNILRKYGFVEVVGK